MQFASFDSTPHPTFYSLKSDHYERTLGILSFTCPPPCSRKPHHCWVSLHRKPAWRNLRRHLPPVTVPDELPSHLDRFACVMAQSHSSLIDFGMFHIILHHPEIPPNTGNVIRLCANTAMQLHLIRPLGFSLDNARLRRAGLDYREYADIEVHDHWDAFRAAHADMRLWAMSTRGSRRFDEADFREGDGLVFGSESRGLEQSVFEDIGLDRVLRLPMANDSRSLNLSNAVAVTAFEAWRQNDFAGGR
jgi:tRNA (cytidine/uridine-2'-O-)-methyltransferase